MTENALAICDTHCQSVSRLNHATKFCLGAVDVVDLTVPKANFTLLEYPLIQCEAPAIGTDGSERSIDLSFCSHTTCREWITLRKKGKVDLWQPWNDHFIYTHINQVSPGPTLGVFWQANASCVALLLIRYTVSSWYYPKIRVRVFCLINRAS